MVMVYRFKGYDISTDAYVSPARKATAEFIAANKCMIIEGTGEDVPDDAVDGDGRYNPDS